MRRERTGSRAAGAHKKSKTQRQGPGHPGPETRESQRQRGRGKEEKSKKKAQGTERRQQKPRDTRRGGGGNHQAAANGQAGSTKEAKAPGEPRSARPTKQTTHSAKAQGTRGRKPKKARDKGGARKTGTGKRKKKEANRGGGGQTKDQERGNPSLEGAEQSRKTKRPEEKVRRTKTRPGGRPARPGEKGRAHAHTHGTRAWRPPTRKGRCRRPHKTALMHRPSPMWNDGQYGKPDTSVTGSTHSNHHSARSPRPTPEGPTRNNPIAGPRTGTTRSESSAPASAGASGRQNEPGSRSVYACPAQPPSKSAGASPRGGKRHHGVWKANWSTESDRTGRGGAHNAGPRGTPQRRAAGNNQGTRTGAKQRRPPGAANPESAHSTQRTTARGQVPSNTSPRPDRRVRAGQRMQPLPATEQRPSGWTRVRPEGTKPLPATKSRHGVDE